MLGWLTRVVVGLALTGILLFDGISIATARLSVEDDATAVAREASETYQRTGDVQQAYLTASTYAVQADALNEVPPTSFHAAPDGTVSLDVHRTATTLVISRVGWVRDWADVTAHGSGRTGS